MSIEVYWDSKIPERGAWRGKLVTKRGPIFAELRKTFTYSDPNFDGDYESERMSLYGAMKIIVATEGYMGDGPARKNENFETTRDLDVKISMNGPCAMSFDDVAQIQDVIEQARKKVKEANA